MRNCNDRTASPPSESREYDSLGRRAASVCLVLAMLCGCVTVQAPDKPIVIELNVNIRQEVIYRLAADAKNTVEENQDIF